MNTTFGLRLAPVVVLAALPLLAACGVTVTDHDGNGKGNLDIQSPFGSLSVRTDVDTKATGLPVYPGARPLHDGREPESANVSIDSSLFGLEVLAAKYESDVAPDTIVEYYNREMRTFGAVTECRGNIDFKGSRGSRQPVCKAKGGGREVQLVAGTEDRHRIVSVKPRGDGSEFAVVYIRTRERS